MALLQPSRLVQELDMAASMTEVAPEPADRAVARVLAGGLDEPPRIRHITQTILAGNPGGIPGNCVQAAVASLLDMDLDQVPHFALTENWLQHLVYWSALRGWMVLRRSPEWYVPFGIASGPSVRGVLHAVVILDGRVDWDPHPSRAGLLSVSSAWEFRPGDPNDNAYQLRLGDAPRELAAMGVPLY
jgi:hypothetical protein